MPASSSNTSTPLTDEEHHRAARGSTLVWKRTAHAGCAATSPTIGRRMICEFEAPDAEAVRQSMRSAEVSFERVWTSEVFRRDEPDIK